MDFEAAKTLAQSALETALEDAKPGEYCPRSPAWEYEVLPHSKPRALQISCYSDEDRNSVFEDQDTACSLAIAHGCTHVVVKMVGTAITYRYDAIACLSGPPEELD